MGAILLGSFIYFVLFLVAAYFITDKTTKDVNDPKLKSEYRWYNNSFILGCQ